MALGSRQGCRWCGRAALGQPRRRRVPEPARCSARPYSEGGGASEAAGGAELLEVCWRRLFLRGGAGPLPWSAYLSGRHPGFGPLGAALRANLAAQWWDSALPVREQVFPVDAPLHGPPGAQRDAQGLRLLHPETLREALQGCGQSPGGPALEEALGAAGQLRESLLPGRSRAAPLSLHPAHEFLAGSEAAAFKGFSQLPWCGGNVPSVCAFQGSEQYRWAADTLPVIRGKAH